MEEEKKEPKVTIINTNQKFFGNDSKGIYFKKNQKPNIKEVKEEITKQLISNKKET